MYVKQFVDEGLGNSSYLVGSEEAGLAAVIDPQRDVERYVQAAEAVGLRLTHALDTHLHADFISGALELRAQLGLTVGASASAEAEFEHLRLSEGDEVALGGLRLGVLTTPGHTPESISFTASEGANSAANAIFTGGALIVGGAARTDLLGHDLTVPLARDLYHTIHYKLLKLPDSVTVYPTHGAGSFCVAPTSDDRVTTIGHERRNNNLTQAQNEEEFIELALYGLPAYPDYYKEMRPINQRGPRVLGGLPVLTPLAPAEVRDLAERGTAVLDARNKHAIHEAHIPGAYGIPMARSLGVWAGWLIPFGTPLVLVTDSAADRVEAVRQLIRVGYDNLRGYLEGGMEAWGAAGLPVSAVKTMRSAELRELLNSGGEPPLVLDVRHDSEWIAGHIPGAVHIENGRLPYADLPLPVDRTIAVHCATGFRATAAVSVLLRRGFHDLVIVEDGFDAWRAAGFEMERGE